MCALVRAVPRAARLARLRTDLVFRCRVSRVAISFPLERADGEYEVDELITLQSGLTPSDALTVQYTLSAAGGQTLDRRQVTHAQALATSAAAADAAGMKRGDVVVLTAPLFGHFGFAAGALAAMRAGAKLGASIARRPAPVVRATASLPLTTS